MDKKELKDMSDAELLEELERLNNVVDDMFDDEEEEKWLSSFLNIFSTLKMSRKRFLGRIRVTFLGWK